MCIYIYIYIYIYTYIYIYIYIYIIHNNNHTNTDNNNNNNNDNNNNSYYWHYAVAHRTLSREIEPVRRSFCRRRSCTFTEVARLVPSRRTPGSCNGGRAHTLEVCSERSAPNGEGRVGEVSNLLDK